MKKLIVAFAIVMGVLGLGMAQPVLAAESNVCDDPEFQKEEYKDIYEAAGCNLEENKTILPGITTIIAVILAMASIIAGIALIYGGITYIISTGEASKIQKAKNIIMYALIGLVVSMLAYAIVTFVTQHISE